MKVKTSDNSVWEWLTDWLFQLTSVCYDVLFMQCACRCGMWVSCQGSTTRRSRNGAPSPGHRVGQGPIIGGWGMHRCWYRYWCWYHLDPFGSIWSFGDLGQWKIMENRYTMKIYETFSKLSIATLTRGYKSTHRASSVPILNTLFLQRFQGRRTPVTPWLGKLERIARFSWPQRKPLRQGPWPRSRLWWRRPSTPWSTLAALSACSGSCMYIGFKEMRAIK